MQDFCSFEMAVLARASTDNGFQPRGQGLLGTELLIVLGLSRLSVRGTSISNPACALA